MIRASLLRVLVLLSLVSAPVEATAEELRFTRSLNGHERWVLSLAISPDSARLVSGSDDQTLRIWDVATGLSRTLRKFDSAVTALAFSKDGSRLAVGTWDGELLICDAETGKVVRELSEHEETITTVTFDPSGDYLASGSADDSLAVGTERCRGDVGCAQVALLFAMGHFLFGMRVGGSVFALGMITICVVFAATSLGLLVASFGGTEKQISGYSMIAICGMGLVGGCMFPRIFMPEGMKAAGNFVPHGWALDAYYEVLVREGTTLADVSTPCLAIAGFGLLFTILASFLFRFER